MQPLGVLGLVDHPPGEEHHGQSGLNRALLRCSSFLLHFLPRSFATFFLHSKKPQLTNYPIAWFDVLCTLPQRALTSLRAATDKVLCVGDVDPRGDMDPR